MSQELKASEQVAQFLVVSWRLTEGTSHCSSWLYFVADSKWTNRSFQFLVVSWGLMAGSHKLLIVPQGLISGNRSPDFWFILRIVIREQVALIFEIVWGPMARNRSPWFLKLYLEDRWLGASHPDFWLLLEDQCLGTSHPDFCSEGWSTCPLLFPACPPFVNSPEVTQWQSQWAHLPLFSCCVGCMGVFCPPLSLVISSSHTVCMMSGLKRRRTPSLGMQGRELTAVLPVVVLWQRTGVGRDTHLFPLSLESWRTLGKGCARF